MEATYRNTDEIVRDLQKAQPSGMTFPGTYMDVYRKKPVVHIPMDKDQTRYFSFGIEKAEMLNKLIESGEFKHILEAMRGSMRKIEERKARENDVIQI